MKAKINGMGALQNVVLEFDTNDMKTLWRGLSFIESLPHACGDCGNESIFPVHRKTKEDHDYYEIECRACGSRSQLGQKRADGSLFYRRNATWEKPPTGGNYDDGNSWEKATPAPPQQPRPQPAQARPQAPTPRREDEFPAGEDLPF